MFDGVCRSVEGPCGRHTDAGCIRTIPLRITFDRCDGRRQRRPLIISYLSLLEMLRVLGVGRNGFCTSYESGQIRGFGAGYVRE